MTQFKSTKIFDGFSTAFRQHRATHSHCQFVHGYALKFKVWFEGELDHMNYVCDFGCFKRNGIKEELANQFDHTTVVAADDPHLEIFYLSYHNTKMLVQYFLDNGFLMLYEKIVECH